MMHQCANAPMRYLRLKHYRACLLKECFYRSPFFAYLDDKMITKQMANLVSSRPFAAKMKASHHVFAREFLRQTFESLESLLFTLEVHTGILQLVVEISLGHGAKVVALTSVLDVGVSNQPHPSRIHHTSNCRLASSGPNGA